VNPEWTEALFGMGLVCTKLKQPQEAIKYLLNALSLKEDKSVRYLLSLAYRNNGEFE